MDLNKLSNAELAEYYENLSSQEEEIVAAKVEVRVETLKRLKKDAEIWGNFSVSKRRNYTFTATIEQAREFGCVVTKEALDSIKLKKLYLSGANVPGEVIIKETPLFRNVTGEHDNA